MKMEAVGATDSRERDTAGASPKLSECPGKALCVECFWWNCLLILRFKLLNFRSNFSFTRQKGDRFLGLVEAVFRRLFGVYKLSDIKPFCG